MRIVVGWNKSLAKFPLAMRKMAFITKFATFSTIVFFA
jgi:hypothetical protein